MKKPLVSVIMPIYNSEGFLDEAILSILNQTFTDFELIAIDDSSTDSSLSIIKKYMENDSRINLIENNINIGFVKNLNRAINIAKGKYIARMDSDDISDPTRFIKQVEFLNSHPSIGIVGSWVNELGTKKVFKYPLAHNELYKYLIYGSPFGHPAVMIRRSVLTDNNIFYNENYKVAQDYELWSRLLNVTKGANIPEVLLLWRKHKQQRSETNKGLKFQNSIKISLNIYRKFYCNDKIGESYLEKLFINPKEKNIYEVFNTIDYLDSINKDCDPEANIYLYKKISKKIYIYCRNNVQLGYKVYKYYIKSKWNDKNASNRLSKLKFLALSIYYSIRNTSSRENINGNVMKCEENNV